MPRRCAICVSGVQISNSVNSALAGGESCAATGRKFGFSGDIVERHAHHLRKKNEALDPARHGHSILNLIDAWSERYQRIFETATDATIQLRALSGVERMLQHRSDELARSPQGSSAEDVFNDETQLTAGNLAEFVTRSENGESFVDKRHALLADWPVCPCCMRPYKSGTAVGEVCEYNAKIEGQWAHVYRRIEADADGNPLSMDGMIQLEKTKNDDHSNSNGNTTVDA